MKYSVELDREELRDGLEKKLAAWESGSFNLRLHVKELARNSNLTDTELGVVEWFGWLQEQYLKIKEEREVLLEQKRST